MLRVGLIIPSSNVVIEDMLHSKSEPFPSDIGIHIARLPVTTVDLGPDSKKQFEADAVNQAIDQLLEAEVSLIIFAGTAGAWLGVERERSWCADAAQRSGVVVTSTTLLALQELKTAGFGSLGLVTPFTSKVHNRIVENFQSEGFSVGFGSSFGLDSSRQMANLTPDEIASRIDMCFENGSDGVLCFCTNFRGFEASRLARSPHAPAKTLDSVQLTLEAAGVNGF